MSYDHLVRDEEIQLQELYDSIEALQESEQLVMEESTYRKTTYGRTLPADEEVS